MTLLHEDRMLARLVFVDVFEASRPPLLKGEKKRVRARRARVFVGVKIFSLKLERYPINILHSHHAPSFGGRTTCQQLKNTVL
jgi:hypothetical protein